MPNESPKFANLRILDTIPARIMLAKRWILDDKSKPNPDEQDYMIFLENFSPTRSEFRFARLNSEDLLALSLITDILQR